MNFPADASNWMDVIDHIAVIIGALLLAAIPSWLAARNHRSLSEVKNQVKNAHTTNLRDDLDRAIAAVEMLGNDFRGMRHDLAAEEERRRKQISELREEIDRRPVPVARRRTPREVK
jgi:hypothetical protein